jgi:hypothetical protein
VNGHNAFNPRRKPSKPVNSESDCFYAAKIRWIISDLELRAYTDEQADICGNQCAPHAHRPACDGGYLIFMLAFHRVVFMA